MRMIKLSISVEMFNLRVVVTSQQVSNCLCAIDKLKKNYQSYITDNN